MPFLFSPIGEDLLISRVKRCQDSRVYIVYMSPFSEIHLPWIPWPHMVCDFSSFMFLQYLDL